MSESTGSIRQIPVHTLPALAAAIVCGLAGFAGFSWQVEDFVSGIGGAYGFYMLVRVITFSSALVLCYVGVRAKSVTTVWCFGLIAVLFNPIAEIGLGKEMWRWVDLAASLTFLVSLHSLIPEWLIRHFQSNKAIESDGKPPRTPAESSTRNVINFAVALFFFVTIAIAWPKAEYPQNGSSSTSSSLSSSTPPNNSTQVGDSQPDSTQRVAAPSEAEEILAIGDESSGDLYPETAIRELTSADTSAMSDDDLQYAITEIVIRHGYDPKRVDVKRLFARKRGRHFLPVRGRTLSEAEALMSETEATNYYYLAAQRESRKRAGAWTGPD